jgi:hypothetical protein
MSWDLQMTQSADWIPPSATKKFSRGGVIWWNLVETYHIIKHLSSLSVALEPWEGRRLFYDSSSSTSVYTRFSHVVIYHISPSYFGHSYYSFSLWVIIPNSFLYFTMTGFDDAPCPPKPRHVHHCIWFFIPCSQLCVLSYWARFIFNVATSWCLHFRPWRLRQQIALTGW